MEQQRDEQQDIEANRKRAKRQLQKDNKKIEELNTATRSAIGKKQEKETETFLLKAHRKNVAEKKI